jgi:5-methylcytosine-specific restriction endonuclease McrA
MPHWFSSRGHVRVKISKKTSVDYLKWKLTREEYDLLVSSRNPDPFLFTIDHKRYWLFEGKFYKDNETLKRDEVRALLLARKKAMAQRINRAKSIAFAEVTTSPVPRGAIPDDVKLLIWQRYGGKCAKCGATTELQFDHIIPFSLGGASTPENLQILCGRCNRAKSASVA